MLKLVFSIVVSLLWEVLYNSEGQKGIECIYKTKEQ
jgi:hypothetical protein